MRPVVPLVVSGRLFVLPIVTRINVAGIEIEQPTAVAPSATDLEAVSWDAVTEKVVAQSSDLPTLMTQTTELPRAHPP